MTGLDHLRSHVLWALGQASLIVHEGAPAKRIHITITPTGASISIHDPQSPPAVTRALARAPDEVYDCGEPGELGFARWARWRCGDGNEVSIAGISPEVTRENWPHSTKEV